MEQMIGGQAAPDDMIKDTDTANFVADVIEASQSKPIIVDFWAPWCGPCKTLTPLLEKVVASHRGKVTLVKINVDENQQLAAQMRVQSIPQVFAFAGGRPVDGFSGALPEQQIKSFVDKLAEQFAGADPLDQALEEAATLMEAGDFQQAGGYYQQILQADPSNVKAFAGLVKALLGLGEQEQAEAVLAQAPPEIAESKEIQDIKAQLALQAEASEHLAQASQLEAAVAADENNHQARYDLAMAQYAAGEVEAAMEGLLEIFKRDREWNEDGARKKLLELFDAIGAADKRVLAARRKLSSFLFS